jgi:uncharacterized protein (DUF433 family)
VSALFPYFQRGVNTEEILEAFPHLTIGDVRAARKEFAASAAS